MQRIYQLPPEVANQIAAGEVIERPASVVKELLENALDAQAQHVHVDIECGGMSLIRIRDDGIGIASADLQLAIAPHATSKIQQIADLNQIKSMGFRGEALASIASVSQITIVSKPGEQGHGMQIDNYPRISIIPCARTVGTTIEVKHLFYNVPVRKKFLKSEKTELQAIENIVKRFALSAPQIAISLFHNGKKMLSLAAAKSREAQMTRIKKLLGKGFTDEAIHLNVQDKDLKLYGWISNKNYQRNQSDKIWVYLNQRMIRDKLILQAVKQAYSEILYPGKFPSCVLYLEIPSEEVDVNVHPTKHEVRFHQPRLIHDLFFSQIKKGLGWESPDIHSPSYQDSTLLKIKEKKLSSNWIAESEVSRQPPSSSWINLNKKTVLIFCNQEPFLVDIEKLYKKFVSDLISKTSRPWKTRPILVPLSYVVDDGEAFIQAFQNPLKELGIATNLIGHNLIRVLTLPAMLPHLDLSNFFQHLSKKPKDIFSLRELLISCQSFETNLVSQEECEELIVFFHNLVDSQSAQSWCLKLDIKGCRQLLNG